MTVSGGLLSSCAYDPYVYGPASPHTSVSSSVGYSSGGHVSSSLLIRTSSSRWGYDPHCHSYYDYTTRCYYDPWLHGYYPRGYRPPVIFGAPHPHGWRPGMAHCPPPGHVRNHRIVNYHQRQQHYRNLHHGWAKNVRCSTSESRHGSGGPTGHSNHPLHANHYVGGNPDWNGNQPGAGNARGNASSRHTNGNANRHAHGNDRGGAVWQNPGNTASNRGGNNRGGNNRGAIAGPHPIETSGNRGSAGHQSNRPVVTYSPQPQTQASTPGPSRLRSSSRSPQLQPQVQSNASANRMAYARERIQQIEQSRGRSR